jgi:hypothetical protein
MLYLVYSLLTRRSVQAIVKNIEADCFLAIVRLDYRVVVALDAECSNLEYLGCRIGPTNNN